MIDLENYIFDSVATTLRSTFSGILVEGQYVDTPASFPCVTIEQSASSVVKDFRTDKIENLTSVMFEVNVYSNNTIGRKAEAKQIMAKADECFTALGFTRNLLNPIPNLADATIYRLVARYTANIDKVVNGTSENYIIYQD